MNRTKIIILSFIILSAIILTGCCKKIKSTDLLNIYLDNMNVGMEIDPNDLSKYTSSDRYSGNYKYKFEEIIIDSDNENKINYLFARFDENNIDIKVNNVEVKTINDVVNILGNNYQDKTYDKEQQLREYVYIDNGNNIKAEFIYSTWNNNLVWVILSK